jgi:hypothetical protein
MLPVCDACQDRLHGGYRDPFRRARGRREASARSRWSRIGPRSPAPGTMVLAGEGAFNPFFSPGGRRLGFIVSTVLDVKCGSVLPAASQSNGDGGTSSRSSMCPKASSHTHLPLRFCRARRPRLNCRFHLNGEMSEWLKEHAWKACVGETLPWVRIPLSPPTFAHACHQRVSYGWQATRRLSAEAPNARKRTEPSTAARGRSPR